MAVHRYSIEQLLHLRNSPLVQKPDNLPAIEQWIDESQQTQRPQRPPPREGGTSSPMGNFSAGQLQRSGLTGTKTTSKDDVSLGPPRTIFASSRTTSRLADVNDTSNTGDALDNADGRQGRMNAARKGPALDTEGKAFRESWTSARDRRTAGVEDEGTGERGARYGRRDREHDGERRGGFPDRQDPRWGSRDDRRNNNERDRRWRSRERPRDREWDRGTHHDREPEWMDDPHDKSDGDSTALPKNQEDFEKWKQAQHARDKKPVPEDESRQQEPAVAAAAPVVAESALPTKSLASLQLDSATNRTLHDWGKQTSAENIPAAKSATSKSKPSRFMPMFKKDEMPEESPGFPTHVQKLSADLAATSSEDKEGFQKIMLMLSGSGTKPTPPSTSVEPTSPQSRASGARSKSRFTGFFDQSAKPSEGLQPPGVPISGEFRSMEDGQGARDRAALSEGGPVHAFPADEHRDSRQAGHNSASPFPIEQSHIPSASRDLKSASGRAQDIGQDRTHQGSATPDINIQNLLASQRIQRAPGPDKNSEFLLNLLQAKGSSNSRPQSQQARAEAPFPLWLDQPTQRSESQPQKPHMQPAPGFHDEQSLRVARDEVNAGRPPSQRPPPGFFDEPGMFLQQTQAAQSTQQPQSLPSIQQSHEQQQRRNAAEASFGRMPPGGGRSNGMPNMPPMQMPPPQRIPPEFMAAPPSGYMHGPPPGFNAHAPRHPPGFHNIPNIFQQREPPVPGLGMAHPNAPPGFFGGPAPPGLPPGLMPMRSTPNDGPAGAAAGGIRGAYGVDGMGRGR